MTKIKNIFSNLKKSHLQIAGVLFLILLAVFLLWFSNRNSWQPVPSMLGDIYFDGEYRIEDGEWKEIVEGEHISSMQGDVTLRGKFHMLAPNGEYAGVYMGDIPIVFYVDHINVSFYAGGKLLLAGEMEDPIYGISNCGVMWSVQDFMYTDEGYEYFTSGSDDPLEIVIHNPHVYGNETAIDEMLSSVSVWNGADFQNEILKNGESQRNTGIALMLISLVFLGIALFSTLIHVKNSTIMWLLGLVVLCAGGFFAYSAEGVSFWSESRVTNTTLLGVSMMFYMTFVSAIIAYLLSSTKRVGNITAVTVAAFNALFLVLPMISNVLFYDTWLWWVLVQNVANVVLSVCILKEFRTFKTKMKWIYIGAILPLVAFAVDTFCVWRGALSVGVVSKYAFMILLAVATVMVLKLIPNNINAAAKAKELEMEKIVLNAELAESRILTMMSQIRPHFIYNTLGSIEQLCDIDPKKAGELVHDFAKYLRGNFGELDNPKPILMSQEMDHVRHYVSIENVRFPDMTFTFEMNSTDFSIPALTIQPIVENAIKHGLMKLQKGGTVHVVSYETDENYCVSVEDDGVGFDTRLLLDERKHVGLRNIRERLKAMVRGTLEIESAVGVGTKVLIKIPKETEK